MSDEQSFGGTQPGTLPADTTAEELARLAAEHPALWHQIWSHPNCYDELRHWIADRSAEAAEPAPELGPEQLPVAPWQQAQGATPASTNPAPVAPVTTRKRPILLIAGVAVAALVLAGSGIALAANGTLGGWFGAGTGPSAVATAETQAAPSFADGLEVRWQIRGDEFGSRASVNGHLPRMMPAISQLQRTDQPIQLRHGVLVPITYGLLDDGAGQYSWVMFNPDTGEQEWVARTNGQPISCALNAEQTEAACLERSGANTRLIRLTADGLTPVLELGADAPTPSDIWFENGAYALTDGSGVVLIDRDGTQLSRTPTSDPALPPVTSMGPDRRGGECGWLIAAGSESILGSACAQYQPRAVQTGSAFNWSVIDEAQPKIIVSEFDQVRVIDAASRAVVCRIPGLLPGSYQPPQLVQRAAGPGLLVQQQDAYAVVDLTSCDSTPIVSALDHPQLAVVGEEIIAFSGEDERTLSRYEVFDGDSGARIAAASFTPIEQVAEVVGGPSGVTLAHYLCDGCTTAEGSHSIRGYTFLGPAAAGAGEAEMIAATEDAPDFIPDCPGDTVLLAWMELDEGWIVVCGVDLQTPSYVAYQPGKLGAPKLSLGAAKPTAELAKKSVVWDPTQRRYVAAMADGTKLTLDYTIGTATLRDGEHDTDVLAQQRFVRYVYVPLGTGQRGIKESSAGTGAFDVKAPEATATDQIRYMVEVLEKAYEGRAMLKDALPKLAGCTAGPGGYADTIAAMRAVRDNRAELLRALDAMPVDKIPEGTKLLADLTRAIELSHQANVEYVAWAEAANTNGCATLSAAGKAAADASDAPKDRFASRWNSVVAPKFQVRTFDAWYI